MWSKAQYTQSLIDLLVQELQFNFNMAKTNRLMLFLYCDAVCKVLMYFQRQWQFKTSKHFAITLLHYFSMHTMQSVTSLTIVFKFERLFYFHRNLQVL